MTRRICPALLPALALLLACEGSSRPGDVAPRTRELEPARGGEVERPAAADDGAAQDAAVAVKSVYGEPVPELAEARQLCDALHLLPARRRAACCDDAGAGQQAQQLADECSQALSSAVAGGGMVVRDDALAACIAGLELAHASCEWVGPWSPPRPPSCREVTLGTLAAQARCRSSHECAPGLHCEGVGPTDPGVCAPAAADDAPCDTAVDPLATYLRDDGLTDHPVCSGRCVGRRCQPALAAGAPCTSNSECGVDLRCDGKTCVPGETAAPGQPCTDGSCAEGSQCLQHVCVAQAATGTACTTDLECRGACIKAGDGAGRCGPKCG